jgi:hypothetical protein
MLRSILYAGVLSGLALTAQAQSDPWTQNGDWVSSAVQSCKDSTGDASACLDFAGQALDRLLGASEFCSDSRCMLMAEIENELRNKPEKWQLIGGASDQAVLDKAREMAASGKIIVAAQSENGLGQVAIIMPGHPVPSGKWAMERVPVGAAARSDAPEKSVYGEGINWVFSDPSKVTLYGSR